jgi:transposase
VGETGREVETACRTEVRMGVFGVGRGSDAGAAVVGLGEAGAGGRDSSGAQGVEGDHAAFHKAKVVGEVGLRRIYQPPYSPERNPAKRVLEEVRRWVEGRRYERIEAKKAAVEEVPRRLEAEGKASSLVGWHYIRRALNALPS